MVGYRLPLIYINLSHVLVHHYHHYHYHHQLLLLIVNYAFYLLLVQAVGIYLP